MTQKKFEFKLNDPALVGVAPIELADGDGSHWGVSDLYEDVYAKLAELVASGVDFETAWWGSKKEIASARCGRQNGGLWVEVSQSMDEDDDLICDALWAVNDSLTPELRARIEALEGEEGEDLENGWTALILRAAEKLDDVQDAESWLLGAYDPEIDDISSTSSDRIEVAGNDMDALQGALDAGLTGTRQQLDANFLGLKNRVLYLFGLPPLPALELSSEDHFAQYGKYPPGTCPYCGAKDSLRPAYHEFTKEMFPDLMECCVCREDVRVDEKGVPTEDQI